MKTINDIGNSWLTLKNINEVLEPYFEKFPIFQNNFCANCLGLKEVQKEDEDIKTCDVNFMDTGTCSICGKSPDVVNPLIYTIAKIHNIEIWNSNTVRRKYISKEKRY